MERSGRSPTALQAGRPPERGDGRGRPHLRVSGRPIARAGCRMSCNRAGEGRRLLQIDGRAELHAPVGRYPDGGARTWVASQAGGTVLNGETPQTGKGDLPVLAECLCGDADQRVHRFPRIRFGKSRPQGDGFRQLSFVHNRVFTRSEPYKCKQKSEQCKICRIRKAQIRFPLWCVRTAWARARTGDSTDGFCAFGRRIWRNRKSVVFLPPERWQSGRLRRS